MNYSIKIMLKTIVVCIEIILIGVIINNIYNNSNKSDIEISSSDPAENLIYSNSYYTDATIVVESIHRENTIRGFFLDILNAQYDNAFDKLTDECKMELFNNDEQIFNKDFVAKLNIKDKNDYSLEFISEKYFANNSTANYLIKTANTDIDIIIEDNGPFKQKINIISY